MSYEVIEYFIKSKDNDAFGEQILAIKITDGYYKGTVYSYVGGVEFPHWDEPICKFTFDVYESELDTTTVTFKNTIGDILQDMIVESQYDNSTVFKGGI